MTQAVDPHDSARDARRLGRRASVGIVGAAVNGLFTFVLVIVVTRGLGVEGSGVFFVAVAVMTILAGVSGLGADTGMIFSVPNLLLRGAHRSLPRQLVVALVPVAVLGVISGVAMWFVAEPLAQWIGGPGADVSSAADCLRLLAVILPIVPIYELLLAATRAFDHITTSVVIDKIARPIVQPAAVGIAIASGASLPIVTLSFAAFYPLGVLAAIWGVRDRLGRHSGVGDDAPPEPVAALATAFWVYTWPRSIARICQVAIQRVDVIIVAGVLSASEAGVYGAVSRLMMAGLFFNQAIQQATQPRLSFQLASGEREAARSTYQLSTTWLMMLAWPVYLTLIVFAPSILSLLFGPSFVAGAPALRVLSATMLIATACGLVDVVLLMSGRSRLSLVNLVTALVLNIALNLILVPRIGIVGAAWAWLAAILATNLLPLGQVWSTMRLQPVSRSAVMVAGGAVAFVGVPSVAAAVIGGQTDLALMAGVVLSGLMYIVFLYLARSGLHLEDLYGGVLRGVMRRRGSGSPGVGGGPAGRLSNSPSGDSS